ncbi:quinone oxidoreductase [Alishewanella aestuarii B11]|uniref:Quinone oxidoreductase n=1 Tax=Alishewanella aestuarii B11 TaxID=1197174 RepID=J2IHF5_9ALTE|nr:MDR family oxidoreductase [Alishewanella aestuarii]EJI86672.1 quinone oxidoreductase [Alishewanella aestuarii B11]
MFNALVIDKTPDYRASLQQLDSSRLPAAEVVVDVAYSTLNYKDALAITGKAPVVRDFPMVPGIDLAGTVVSSQNPAFKTGDQVLLNGWGVGEKHWGGLAQRAAVPAAWLQPIPAPLTARQAMIIGTAGYTAMLCVQALLKHQLTPSAGPVLVTGATGGVGSFAVLLLARLGFQVTAATGKASAADYLRQLGAAEIISRDSLSAPGKPLAKEQWAGVVDSVGSHTLANACAQSRYGGVVAACGLAQGMDFPASVAPFILRGITLCGIDSVMQPMAPRLAAWAQLAELLTTDDFTLLSQEISLADAIPQAQALLAGDIQGRLLVNVNS